MQENNKNASMVYFLRSFGTKKFDPEVIPVEDDQTDQRAPVNEPDALYEQFVVSEDMMEELENERIEDFDNDFYDYEDRSDLGVDIAAAADLDYKKSVAKLRKKKAAEVKKDVVPEDNDEAISGTD